MPGTSNSGGRNALPPAMHVVNGTFRGHRHADHETPEPPKGRPTCPGKLSGAAKAEWGRMIARLEETGALSKVDDAALYQYSQLYGETEDITAQRADTAKLVSAVKRSIREIEGAELVKAIEQIVNLQALAVRQTTQLRQGHMAIRQYLVEFGMTPAARTRVKLPPKKQESKAEAFMRRGAGA